MVTMAVRTETVIVEGGALAGTVERGVRLFKGVPFAAPPIGELRWRPPQPVVPWRGVRDASAFGSECPQTQYAEGSVYIRPLQKQSEDCLFLNVWTPAKPGDALPVLVWIHGGALTRGSGISDARDGIPLASQGIVLVTFNYRLGALGYLAHPELTAESTEHASGNYGVLDQIAALKWVRGNIARVWRRPGESDRRRRVGRIVGGEHARRVTAREGTLHPRDRRKRRTVRSHAAAHGGQERAGVGRAGRRRAREGRRRGLVERAARGSCRPAARCRWIPDAGKRGRLGAARRDPRDLRGSEAEPRAGDRRLERQRDDVLPRAGHAAEDGGRLPEADRAAVRRSGGGISTRPTAR